MKIDADETEIWDALKDIIADEVIDKRIIRNKTEREIKIMRQICELTLNYLEVNLDISITDELKEIYEDDLKSYFENNTDGGIW